MNAKGQPKASGVDGVAAAKPGLIRTALTKVGKFTYDILVAHFPVVVTTLLGLGSAATYGWQAEKGNVPGPGDIVEAVKRTLGSTPTPQRPAGIAQIELQSDSSPASRLISPMHLRVVERVHSVTTPLVGTKIVYRLGDLHATGTARSAVDLRWAMRTPGRDWRKCGPVGLQFANHSALVEAIADRLNNAIAATEKAGDTLCS